MTVGSGVPKQRALLVVRTFGRDLCTHQVSWNIPVEFYGNYVCSQESI